MSNEKIEGLTITERSLIDLIQSDVMDKDTILFRLYQVSAYTSPTLRASAKGRLNIVVKNLRKKGFNLANTPTRVYYREDY